MRAILRRLCVANNSAAAAVGAAASASASGARGGAGVVDSDSLGGSSTAVQSSSSSSSSVMKETIDAEAVQHVTLRVPKKIQIAVVGSGPSGCYVADFLTKRNPSIHVDIYEKLPVPFGLLRYGVAPDHPEVKNLEDKFKDLFLSRRATWIGNIDVGRDITVDQLLASYTAVVISTGAPGNKKLSIEGEDLGNVISAQSFVHFYNTYPFPHGSPFHCPFDVASATNAVVIGNGNVAMDVARVLASSYRFWCPTDMNCLSIKQLMVNRIRSIDVVARRGVEHSAFTTAEFRELTTIRSFNPLTVSVDPFDLQAKLALPECQTRAKKRLLELVHKSCVKEEQVEAEKSSLLASVAASSKAAASAAADAASAKAPPSGQVRFTSPDRGPCNIRFRYHLRPVAFLPHPKRRGMVGSVRFERVVGGANGSQAPPLPDSDRYVEIPCEVAIKSIGYCGDDSLRGVPYDHSLNHITHTAGRVHGSPRLYCSGWCKTGPTGVILHTMSDAQVTADTILKDITNGTLKQQDTQGGKYALMDWFVGKQLMPISTNSVSRIWQVEKEKGIDMGKRAEKVNSVKDMMELVSGGKLAKRAHNRIRGIANARPDALLYLSELLDDDTDLRPFAQQLASEMPRHLAGEGVNPDELR